MPITVTEYVYDLNGRLPGRSFIPHVTLRILDTETGETFDTMILFDTGARSDITFNYRLKSNIWRKLGQGEILKNRQVQVGPLSVLQKQASRSSDNLVYSPVQSEGGLLLPAATLSEGYRDGNTMSLAYFCRTGKTIQLYPEGANETKVTEFAGPNRNGMRPVYTTDVTFDSAIPEEYHQVKASAATELRVKTELRGPERTIKAKIVWDTGAEACVMPKQYFQAIGSTGGMVDKLSLRTNKGVLSFLNVPFEKDPTEIIIGATILGLCRAAIQPGEKGILALAPTIPLTRSAPIEVDK